jgi:PAS domain S-box-containing protein
MSHGTPFARCRLQRATVASEDEAWRVRKDGTRFWASLVLTALYDEGGELRGFAKITRDFTERRAAEETASRLAAETAAREAIEASRAQLKESEERYRRQSEQLEIILQGIADGVTVQTVDGRLLYANDAAAQSGGLASARELMELSIAEVLEKFALFDEMGNPYSAAQLPGHRALAGEKSPAAMVGLRQKGTGLGRWSLVRANAVRDAIGRPILAVNIWHDITEARRRDQEAKFRPRRARSFRPGSTIRSPSSGSRNSPYHGSPIGVRST